MRLHTNTLTVEPTVKVADSEATQTCEMWRCSERVGDILGHFTALLCLNWGKCRLNKSLM